jgi:hypothetical protein
MRRLYVSSGFSRSPVHMGQSLRHWPHMLSFTPSCRQNIQKRSIRDGDDNQCDGTSTTTPCATQRLGGFYLSTQSARSAIKALAPGSRARVMTLRKRLRRWRQRWRHEIPRICNPLDTDGIHGIPIHAQLESSCSHIMYLQLPPGCGSKSIGMKMIGMNRISV